MISFRNWNEKAENFLLGFFNLLYFVPIFYFAGVPAGLLDGFQK